MRSNTTANQGNDGFDSHAVNPVISLKSVLHIANAMDNALPTALTGNFGEARGYSNTRRYMLTIVDLTPTNRKWNTQSLKTNCTIFHL